MNPGSLVSESIFVNTTINGLFSELGLFTAGWRYNMCTGKEVSVVLGKNYPPRQGSQRLCKEASTADEDRTHPV